MVRILKGSTSYQKHFLNAPIPEAGVRVLKATFSGL